MGRVCPRHGHRGRPLNLIVRHQPHAYRPRWKERCGCRLAWCRRCGRLRELRLSISAESHIQRHASKVMPIVRAARTISQVDRGRHCRIFRETTNPADSLSPGPGPSAGYRCNRGANHLGGGLMPNNAFERTVTCRGRTVRAFALSARAGTQWRRGAAAQLGR